MPVDPNAKGKQHIRKDEERTAQGMFILAKRLSGHTIGEIAEDMGLAKNTVKSRIDAAIKAGMLQGAAERVIVELINPAIDVFKEALSQGDVDVARDVLFGAGILSKNNKPQIAPPEPVQARELSLDEYRAQILANLKTIEVEPVPQPELPPGEVEDLPEPLPDPVDPLSFTDFANQEPNPQ